MRAFFLIPLLAVAACATPREQCTRDAGGPYRAALQERARIAQDIARGYVFETRFEQRQRFGWCTAPMGVLYSCWDTDTQPVTRRAPINEESLRARLAELDARLPELRKTAETDTRQCHILYPETPEDR